MSRYSLTHVPDPALLRELRTLVAQDRATTALLLAHLAEVDARRLYAPAGHPSMFAWCVTELRLSEEAAFKRIRAARTARQFPTVFALVAEGGLHLSAVVMLAAYLTPENAEGLLSAAAGQSKAGIEQLLAERFPRPDLPERIGGLVLSPTLGQSAPGWIGSAGSQLSPGTVGATGARLALEPAGSADAHLAPGRGEATQAQLSPGTVGPPARPGVAPLAPGRYGLHFTVAQDTYEKLRYAQALLGHAVPAGELAQVFDRALDALITRLEQRKFAATNRPRPRRHQASASARHVPAEVRRAVWQRDGGQCTFVSPTGQRCPARTRLEFDHIEPVAREGGATAGNLRQRCRAHNQYAAECEFGATFMSHKREAAQRRASEAARRRAAATDEARARTVVAADEARRAAARCEAIPEAPLEARVRRALSGFAGPGRNHAAAVPRSAP